MLNVLFCGARWLGLECLRELKKNPDINVVGAVVPKKTENVWWTDVVDQDIVGELGIELLDWKSATQMQNLDIAISVMHNRIFKKKFIDNVKYGVLNIHPGPLPFYRGSNHYSHALMNGETWYGITLHYIDTGIDTGPIIDLYWTEIDPNDTARTLYDRVQRLGIKLFRDKLPEIIQCALEGGQVASCAQDDEKARYYKPNSLDHKEVDLNWPNEQIYNFVRGLQFPPFEPAYFRHHGKKKHLRIHNGEIVMDCDKYFDSSANEWKET